MKRLFLALFLSLAPVAAGADTFSSDDVRPEMTKADKKLIPAVDAYVRNTRGWMVSDYTIELYRREDDTVTFTVWYDNGDGVSIRVRNNGQAFRAVVDVKSRKVINEYAF